MVGSSSRTSSGRLMSDAGDRQPALHAARQRVDLGVAPVVEAGEVQQLLGAGPDLAPRQAEVAAVDHQVVEHGELGVEVVVLRDDAQASPDRRAVVARVHAEHAQLAVADGGDAWRSCASSWSCRRRWARGSRRPRRGAPRSRRRRPPRSRRSASSAPWPGPGERRRPPRRCRPPASASAVRGSRGSGSAGIASGRYRQSVTSDPWISRAAGHGGRPWAAAPLRATLAAKRSGMRPIGRACGVFGNGAVQIESVDRPERSTRARSGGSPRGRSTYVSTVASDPGGECRRLLGAERTQCCHRRLLCALCHASLPEWPGSAAVRAQSDRRAGRSRGRTTTDALNSVVLNLRSLLGSGRADVTDVVRTGRTRGPCPGRVRVPAPSCGARA